MTEAEIKTIASEAARASVEEMFLRFGIEANSADDIRALQRDFAHLRGWRESTETIKRQGIMTAVGVITLGILGLIWTAISKGTG
jgi:hypothetical protein